MLPTDPQFIYMILVLPGLFGVTLIGDGIYKLAHDQSSGMINIIFGFVFLGVVAFAYFFFSVYLTQQF